MPVSNYCKKCRAEVPPGESCPRCGARLVQTGERMTIAVHRAPVTDWFAWNAMLRVMVPVIGVVMLITVAIEAGAEGATGVSEIFARGFFWTLMLALGALLLAILLLLLAQGPEEARYTLDARGVHAAVYLRDPKPIRFYARLMTPQSAIALQAEATETGTPTDKPFCLVKRVDLPWKEIRRVRFWPETRTILFFSPSYWQALYLRCGETEYAEAEALVRKRLSRNRKALGMRGKKKKA